MSNIQVVNLADNINAAILKINQNFSEIDLSKLTEAEVNALIQSALDDFDVGLDAAAVRAIIEGSDLDMGGNKVLFGNVYPTVGDLPSASTYHGMFAHVHATGAAYFAHGGQWIELANKSDIPDSGSSDVESLDDLDDVELTTLTTGEVLKWDGTKWTNKTDNNDGTGSGSSSFHATIYARSEESPGQPTGGSYDFAANNNQGLLTPPTASDVTWYENLPAAVEGDPSKIWACNYKFVDIQSDTDLIAGGQWSIPYLIGGTPVPVDNSGQDQYAQLLAYKRSSTVLNAGDQPSSDEGEDVGSFNFDTREYSAPTGWKETPYGSVNDGQLYVIGGIASDADGRIDTAILWSNPEIATTGLNGTSVAEIALYQMVERPDGWEPSDGLTPPTKPEATGTLNFGSNEFIRDDSDLWFSSLNAVYAWGENQNPPIQGDIWSSTYSFLIEGDTGTASVENPPGWSDPVPEIIQSRSTYRASLFTRKSRGQDNTLVPPAAIGSGNTVAYSFTNNEFIKTSSGNVQGAGLSDLWYEEPPELDLDNPQDLWEVSTVASLTGWYGVDASLTFSQPKLSINYAIDAEDGFSFVQLSVYKWAATNPGVPPSDGSFDFNSKTFVVPTDWTRNVPNNDDDSLTLYVSSGVASTKGLTESDNNVDSDIAWSSADATTAGGSGRDGRSTFRAVIVKRHDASDTDGPDRPTGGVVNFAGIDKTLTAEELAGANVGGVTSFSANSLTPPVGWYDHVSDIPNEEVPDGKIWAVEQTFAIDGDDSVDIGSLWSIPYEDHNNGEDGYSTFTASVYKRSATQPPADSGGKWGPVNATYNFSTDLVEVESLSDGWSEEPQESNAAKDPLWMCRATATTQGLTGVDLSLTWSEPVKVSTDGENGEPGSGIVVDLSNENHSITAQFDGTLYSNSLFGAVTTLQVFDGDDDITPSQTVVPTLSTGVEKGTGVNKINYTQAGQTTTITHVGKNVDEFTLTFTVAGRSTVFSLTKIRASAPGEPATVYRLINSASVIKANTDNTTHVPETLTATSFKFTGGQFPALATSGTTLILKTNDSDTVIDSSTTGQLEWTIVDSTTSVNLELWVPDINGVMVDQENIPVVFDGTDSGEITVTIPKVETGYLYYTESSDQAPTISATRFTFTEFVNNDTIVDGVFTSLSPTGKWSLSPAGTDLSGDRWAVKFIANETLDADGNPTGYSEGSDLIFSSPFQSYSFDGLVTFENTNNIFVEEAGVTVIDGGKILTNSITADQINTSTLSITGSANDIDTTSTVGTTGERMVITGENIRIYDANSTDETTGLRVKLGKLT